MKRLILIAALLLMPAAAVMADDLPPGKWWRRPELVERLSMTEDQQNRLDAVFRSTATDLIDLRADVEKRNVELRGQLDQPTLSREGLQKAAARLGEARARLFERELMMLVDMRGVLSQEQWGRFRAMLEARESSRGGERRADERQKRRGARPQRPPQRPPQRFPR